MATLHDVDIALDSLPQTGGVTTLETLWLGVPVVTIAGATISARVAASILTVLGLPHLVAADRQEYVAIARRLAGDLGALAGLRASLRNRLTRSILCDVAGYTREVEQAYRAMWHKWCQA
jgi:predicted O-linked N-acetylglucosamine transferase (SPINDLY family)